MKECPICKAISFDDAKICYGCLHRFEDEGPAETIPADLDARMDAWLGEAEDAPSAEDPHPAGAPFAGEDLAEERAPDARPTGGACPPAAPIAGSRCVASVFDAALEQGPDEGAQAVCSRAEGGLGRVCTGEPGRVDGSGEAGSWVMRIEFRGAASRSNAAGRAHGRPFGWDDAVPRFAVTEDGFVVSVGAARKDPARPVSAAAPPQRRRVCSSRSVLRRRSPKASPSPAGASGLPEAAR